MKKVLSSIALLSLSANVFAASLSPQNLVERPLTLADGELAFAGVLAWGEQTDGDNEVIVLPDVAYGVTDNFTIGLGDLRYRFIKRTNNKSGLELTAGLSYAGRLEVERGDDTDGMSIDLSGKYVINRDTAFTFSTQYVRWFEDLRDNRSEIRYSAGIQQNIYNDLTLFARYTFSDLKDFEDNSAHAGSVGVNYAFSKSSDVGFFASYSDFDAEDNGYKADNVFEKSAGIYFTTRF